MYLMHALVVALATQPASPPAAAPIDHCESAVVGQARAALAALRAAERAHGGSDGIAAVYEGTASVEGHYMHPGAVREVPLRLELVMDPRSRGLLVREVSGSEQARQVETTIVLRGRAVQQPAADRPFAELEARKAAEFEAEGAQWLPAAVARAALDAAPSCRPGSGIESGGRAWSPVTYVDAAGRACTILMDAEGRIGGVERLAAHQRLGDACDWARFTEWEERGGFAVPGRISRMFVQAAGSVRLDLSLVSFTPGAPPEGTFLLPQERRGDIPGWGDAAPASAGMEFVPVAPRLWSVEIEAANARVLVIEREKDLIVLGAPDGDAVCGSLVSALAERFADKPIGLATFGHHHPSPSGGLRALAAAGATIVAPRALEVYVRDLLARPVSLGAPAVAAPEPKLELFEWERTIEAGENTVRLIDIGEESAHAFRYVVFYFPARGILFEDDLGYFPEHGAARVTPRLMGLAGALEAMQIEPRRLMQLWPVRGVLREVDWAVVADLVRAERERQRAQ